MTSSRKDSVEKIQLITPPVPTVAVPPRPPNRKQHEQQLEQIEHHIHVKDDQRRKFIDRQRQTRDQLTEIRMQRDHVSEQRDQVAEQLTIINKQVDAKRDQLQRLRSSMPYQNEDHILEQIKKLEYNLRKHNYKPAEEKKIIIEIDRLNRSKKLLKDHNVLKTEMDTLRGSQREIRERRDSLFRQRGDLKKREDEFKRLTNELKENIERAKSEIEEMQNDKRRIISEFRSQEAEHRRFINERREEQRQKRREEKAAHEAERQRELEEIKANAEPYEEQQNLCSTLLSYCLRFDLSSVAGGTNGASQFLQIPGSQPNSGSRRGSDYSNSSNYATPTGPTPATTPIDVKEGFVYKKSNNELTPDAAFFPGTTKKRRHSRNERRNSTRVKPLTHSTEVIIQFNQLGLQPPQTTQDVNAAIEQLKQKKAHFEELAAEMKTARTMGAPTINIQGDDGALDTDRRPTRLEIPVQTSGPELLISTPGDETFPSLPAFSAPRPTAAAPQEAFPSLPTPGTEMMKNSLIFNGKSSPAPDPLLNELTKSIKNDLQLNDNRQEIQPQL